MVAGGWDVWYMVGAETVLPAAMLSEPSQLAIPGPLGHRDQGEGTQLAGRQAQGNSAREQCGSHLASGGGSLKHFRVDWNEEVEAGAGKSTS